LEKNNSKQEKSLNANEAVWGSDVIASALREIDVPYVCLNPGASYRGLHDSIVNFLGNKNPQMLLCLHEEHAVAVAQGYASVTDKPLGVIVHSNVGLMHATMAIFNAWCGRNPVIILGATGPVDAVLRRPWIDWIHTAADQGALVRNYTKWDDQPGSPAAAVDSIRRAAMIARTQPCGPVYVNLDSTIQEMALEAWPEFHDITKFQPPMPPAPAPEDLEKALELLRRAKSPLILGGRLSRSETAWEERIRLAEALGARVYTATNEGAGFPTTHPLHRGSIGFIIRGRASDDLRESDLILSLDWTDLGGTLKQVWPPPEKMPSVISCSMDFQIHNCWSMDYQALPPADLRVATTPEVMVSALLPHLEKATRPAPPSQDETSSKSSMGEREGSGPIGIRDLADVFTRVTAERKISLISKPIGWPPDAIICEHPLDFLGGNGGGGVGAGPGNAVGAALALRDIRSDRIPIAVLGDGDYLMGVNALWTAAGNNIPLLIIVANNRSYFNDELHQENVAKKRGRPVENRWIGQRIDNPAPDLAALARAQGLEGEGPITDLSDVSEAIERAIERVAGGASFVLDVVVKVEYGNIPVYDRKK